MKAIFPICSSSRLSPPFHPFPRSQKTGSFDPEGRRLFRRTTVMASSKEGNNGRSRMVEENMIVLRKRIQEMKMADGDCDFPADWTEWEKGYYAKYNSLIFDAMEALQNKLMNTRPSVAFGMLVLIALSLSLSSALLFNHFVEIANGVLPQFPLN